MADEDRDLFKALDSKHPEYTEYEDRWKQFRDVLGNDIAEKRDYLPHNKLEPTDQYNFRTNISEFIPETSLAVWNIVAALYKEKPKRDFKGQAGDLEPFLKDVDLEGTAINTFMEKVIRQLIGFGSTRILVNTKMPEDGELPSTRREEIEMGIRPYAVLYSPLSIIDWDVDEFNNLMMIRIKEVRHRKSNPASPIAKHDKVTKFIHYDREHLMWWEFTGEEGKEKLVPGGTKVREHGLGMVPMIVRYWPEKLKPMVGQSYISSMSKADIQKFRAESDQSYDTYIHAHPFLKVWTEEEMSELGLGTSSFLHLRPGSGGDEKEDAEYIEGPTSAFEALRHMINDKLETIRRHARTDPLGSMEKRAATAFQTSGAARAWSFGTSEARILSDLADTAVDIENGLYDLVLRTQDKEERRSGQVWMGDIQYPEEFDLSATNQLIEETAQIEEMINSPTLVRVLHKRIAASKVGDAVPKTLKTIHDEIEKNPLINTAVGKTQTNVMQFPNQEEGETEEPEEEKIVAS
jgi:hypothetical protein